MQSFQEQKDFFESRWPALQAAAQQGGAPAVIGLIDREEDPLSRRVLYLFARQGLVMREWEGRSLDTYVQVIQAGIDALLREAEASDEESRARRTELANVVSYNLAADLADCWPDDGNARTREHFEAGRKAAANCVRWREQLDKGSGPLSMAWWAKGMHELSLGLPAEAATSWAASLEHAQAGAESPQAFGVVLGKGYLGIARQRAGEAAGAALFEEACAQFESQLKDEALHDDARFGLDQIRLVAERYPA